jgi:CNT family concentrative nucleoside transporter
VLSGLAIQLGLGILILWTSPGQAFFHAANEAINALMRFSDAGSQMVFGEGFREHFFAFSVLPTIVFFSSLMAILFHLGWIQKVVRAMAWIMVRLMNVSGSESVASAANVFVGQTEAALVIKPYISSMTRSEIMALMVGGMANVAGGVMAAYVSFGAQGGHLLAASLLTAPGSLLLAKVLLPERENSPTRGQVALEISSTDRNALDAACRGASEGLMLALNVAAMLIAFIALSALANGILNLLPQVGGEALSVERILGWFFSPLAWLLGVPSGDVMELGRLLGIKTFLNEFVAYVELSKMKETLDPRSFTIATYALCGFANFSSIAIQIGGIGALVPNKRNDLAELGLRAMIGGLLSSLMAAGFASVLLP